jgi:hypothetical protein
MKNLASFIIASFSLLIVYFYVDNQKWDQYKNVEISDFFLGLLFSFFLHQLSTLNYTFFKKDLKIRFSVIDFIFFPHVSGLWSFIFPFQGSSIFSVLFFKARYNLKINTSMSLALYLYSIVISLAGVFSAVYFAFDKSRSVNLLLVSIIFMLNPLLANILKKAFQTINFKNKFIKKLINEFIYLIENILTFWSDIWLTLKTIALKIIHTFLYSLFLFYLSTILALNLSIADVIVIALISELSLVLKITPANLGVNQLMSGISIALLGKSPEDAVILTLFATLISTILNTAIGIVGNYYFFKTIRLKEIFQKNKIV